MCSLTLSVFFFTEACSSLFTGERYPDIYTALLFIYQARLHAVYYKELPLSRIRHDGAHLLFHYYGARQLSSVKFATRMQVIVRDFPPNNFRISSKERVQVLTAILKDTVKI